MVNFFSLRMPWKVKKSIKKTFFSQKLINGQGFKRNIISICFDNLCPIYVVLHKRTILIHSFLVNFLLGMKIKVFFFSYWFRGFYLPPLFNGGQTTKRTLFYVCLPFVTKNFHFYISKLKFDKKNSLNKTYSGSWQNGANCWAHFPQEQNQIIPQWFIDNKRHNSDLCIHEFNIN